MTEKLKPCPFCGDLNATIGYSGWDAARYVWCVNDCRSSSQIYPTAKEAIAAWNTRAEPAVETTTQGDCNETCVKHGYCRGQRALELLQWFRDTNPTYLAMGLKVKELLEKT